MPAGQHGTGAFTKSAGPSSRQPVTYPSRWADTAGASTGPVTASLVPATWQASATGTAGPSIALPGMRADYEHSPLASSRSTAATISPVPRARPITVCLIGPVPITITSGRSARQVRIWRRGPESLHHCELSRSVIVTRHGDAHSDSPAQLRSSVGSGRLRSLAQERSFGAVAEVPWADLNSGCGKCDPIERMLLTAPPVGRYAETRGAVLNGP